MAQPIKSWQAFRRFYATINQGASSVQAGQAWQEYKQLHDIATGTTRPLPASTSPRRATKHPSPRRVPQAATLISIPLEIGGLIAGYLPPHSIAAMQAVSKRTKLQSQHALEQLCNELPNTDEVSMYLNGLRGDELPYTMTLLRLPHVDISCAVALLYRRSNHESGAILHVAGDRIDINTLSQDGFAAYLNAGLLVDPTTLLAVLTRREGCAKGHPGYGYDLVARYARAVMTTLLEPLLRPEDIESLLNRTASMRLIPLPIPAGGDAEYLQHLLELYLAAEVWLGNIDADLAQQGALDVEDALHIDGGNLVLGAGAYIATLKSLEHVIAHINHPQLPPEAAYPLRRDILSYLDRQLRRNQPFRLGVYTTWRKANSGWRGADVKVRVLSMTDQQHGDYVEHVYMARSNAVRDLGAVVAYGLQELRTEQRLGAIDPISTLAILRAHHTAAEASRLARMYLYAHTRTYWVFLLNDHGMERLNRGELLKEGASGLRYAVLRTNEERQLNRLAVLMLYWGGVESPELVTLVRGIRGEPPPPHLRTRPYDADVETVLRAYQELYQSL